MQSERASRQELEQQRDNLEQQQAELEDLLSRAEAAEEAIVGKSNNAEHNVDAKAQEIEALQAKLSDMESEMRALRCSSSGRDDNVRCVQCHWLLFCALGSDAHGVLSRAYAGKSLSK